MMPFSEACERNKDPIVAVLRDTFSECRQVLEIGSGTGQHAIYFAECLPHLMWRPSERLANMADLEARLRTAPRPNLCAPIVLDVSQSEWPVRQVDAVFTANTLHIMSWPNVIALFAGIDRILPAQGSFAVYGPFRYDGAYTSESNQRFDLMLKSRDPHSGLRDIESLKGLAGEHGLQLMADHDLPANNRLLVWERGTAPIGRRQ
jgi:cyclopropane fatty-acyl-phospholipid synthase-like methyltransferase